MAVKASGQITLSSVVDVYATYRYYLLQSSTAAKPVKPTTFPPSSAWDDVEPGYTDGSTNSLYTVDCTLFSDNSFLYSAVSLSSSYEAAKTAYNKATNALLHTVVQSATAPTATTYMWLDISLDPPVLKRYSAELAAWVIVNDTTEIVYNLEHNFKSDIERTESNIRESVYEQVYLKDDVDAIVSERSAHWERTATGFEMEFVKINKDVEDVAKGVDAEFEEIRKYIRFVDGEIHQGEEGSPFQKIQTSTKESYYDNGAEVAYFSNQMLHVTDGEFLHSLKIGPFALVRRSNGNVSFKKI